MQQKPRQQPQPFEDNQLDRPRYYRRILVDHRFWDLFLNLPPGFQVERVVEPENLLAYDFLVSCPSEDQYRVGIGEHILITSPAAKEFGDGTKVLYHPDLGQEEPPDQPNFRDLSYDMYDLLGGILNEAELPPGLKHDVGVIRERLKGIG